MDRMKDKLQCLFPPFRVQYEGYPQGGYHHGGYQHGGYKGFSGYGGYRYPHGYQPHFYGYGWKTIDTKDCLIIHYYIMEQHVFLAFWLIIEGTTEKVFQLIMPLKSVYNQNLGFIQQKNVFINTTDRFE